MKRLQAFVVGPNPEPTPTNVVVTIAVAAIVGQLLIHALTSMPWWGGLLTVIAVNPIVTLLMLWFDRAARISDPLKAAFANSTRAALILIASSGVYYYLFGLLVDVAMRALSTNYLTQFSMLHLWLVQTFGAAIIVIVSRRRAKKAQPPAWPLTTSD